MRSAVRASRKHSRALHAWYEAEQQAQPDAAGQLQQANSELYSSSGAGAHPVSSMFWSVSFLPPPRMGLRQTPIVTTGGLWHMTLKYE